MRHMQYGTDTSLSDARRPPFGPVQGNPVGPTLLGTGRAPGPGAHIAAPGNASPPLPAESGYQLNQRNHASTAEFQYGTERHEGSGRPYGDQIPLYGGEL